MLKQFFRLTFPLAFNGINRSFYANPFTKSAKKSCQRACLPTLGRSRSRILTRYHAPPPQKKKELNAKYCTVLVLGECRKLCTRERPFRLKIGNWIRFACVSLVHFKNSGLFFRFKFFASLHLSYVRFEAKRRANLFFASNISFHCRKHFFCIFSLRYFRFEYNIIE